MNSKTAKKLRRIAKAFVYNTGMPLDSISKEYKRIKLTYKAAKGHI